MVKHPYSYSVSRVLLRGENSCILQVAVSPDSTFYVERFKFEVKRRWFSNRKINADAYVRIDDKPFCSFPVQRLNDTEFNPSFSKALETIRISVTSVTPRSFFQMTYVTVTISGYVVYDKPERKLQPGLGPLVLV